MATPESDGSAYTTGFVLLYLITQLKIINPDRYHGLKLVVV